MAKDNERRGGNGRYPDRKQSPNSGRGNKENLRSKKRRKSDREAGIVIRILVIIFIMLAFIGFSGFYRVWYIKLNKGAEYEAASINNQVNKVRDEIVNPNRGDILDRNHQSLALGNTVFNIVLDVRILSSQSSEVQAETIDKINSILGVDKEEIQGYLKKDANGRPDKDTNYLVIAKKVEYTKGKAIEALGYNWLYTETDTKRSYTNNTLAAQVLGFMRGDVMTGLEKEYNDEMTGTPGRNFRTYEEDGSVVTQLQEPIKGNTLITTIDQTMQQYADDACKTAYNSYGAEYTSTIIMNPGTGEVYAMAQYPGFDANDPMKLTDLESKPEVKEKWSTMTDEERSVYANKAWSNFNITKTFEPGSIYKPIVVAMALEEGLINPTSTFVCNGSKTVAGWSKPIHCHKVSGHGQLDVQGVLANSCNVGMMEMISKMDPAVYYKYHHDFGFHQKTGIDLPDENAVDNSSLMYTLDRLNNVEMATSSFGQGFNCTALQALNAFCVTINGGKLMRPYVVSQVVDAQNNVVKENSPKVVRQVISQETSDYLRKAMQAVLSSEGTGKKAVIQGYAMGGKTGTAEQSPRDHKTYTLSFISYLTVDNPDIIVMTVIHKPEGYYDGCDISPVPMLRNIMEKIIQYKAIAPSSNADTTDIPLTGNTAQLKDYKGTSLKNTIAELVSMGLDFEVLSSGGDTVTAQHPDAGTAMEKGGKVLLNTENKSGSELIAVPDVTGNSVENAKQMLEAVGFGCSIYNDGADNDEDSDNTNVQIPSESSTEETTDEPEAQNTEASLTVSEQSPSAGKKIEAGTIVQIKVK